MKTISRPAIMILILLLSSAVYEVGCHADQSGQWFHVQWVTDGDTITLSDGRRVRYIGINSPETAYKNRPAEPFAEQARSFNIRLVEEKRVRLERDKQATDSYGRTLAYVFLKDGTFVNAELIKAGYAYCLYVKPNTRYYPELLEDQRYAMRNANGIWHSWQKRGGTYIGNRNSRRFHRRDCRFGNQIHPSHRTLFNSLWNAFREGYAPCRKCRPWQ